MRSVVSEEFDGGERPVAVGASGSASSLIDELVLQGARRMLAEALQVEVEAYIERYTGERDEHGRRLVVRNGCHQSREVLTSAGAVGVTAPRGFITGRSPPRYSPNSSSHMLRLSESAHR